MTTVRFTPFDLPELELLSEIPTLDRRVFQERFAQLEAARKEAGLELLAIYADREHNANMSWLTGFDPRFEEALWLQGSGSTPTLLVGNENISFARSRLQLEAKVQLYQPFSLPGQVPGTDWSREDNLPGLLRAAGIDQGVRCGLIGWKPELAESDVPYWIVRAIAELSGEVPANAASLLMDPENGLRIVLEPEMIRFCEYASSLTSNAVRTFLFGLREGISERDAAEKLNSCGLELSCHTMTNFGSPIPSGLKSPRNALAKRGEYGQVALGVVGALTSRAGRLVTTEDSDSDGYHALVENYLRVVRAWYAQIRVGAAAGDVVAAARGAKSEDWDFALNPGHLLHLDEWAASPFVPGSAVALRSGMAIQQDIIPVPRQGNAALNMEDGFVLANEALREELRHLDTPMMNRCEVRRQLMERLGYEVHPDILPLSNIAGVLFPFLLEPTVVASFA